MDNAIPLLQQNRGNERIDQKIREMWKARQLDMLETLYHYPSPLRLDWNDLALCGTAQLLPRSVYTRRAVGNEAFTGIFKVRRAWISHDL